MSSGPKSFYFCELSRCKTRSIIFMLCPTAPPSPPQMINVVSDSLDCSTGVENFIVSWQCPADTSGAAVTNFTVSVDGGNPQTFVGTAEMSDPIPVVVNEEHTFSVAASNCFGTGLLNSISRTPQARGQLPSVMSMSHYQLVLQIHFC